MVHVAEKVDHRLGQWDRLLEQQVLVGWGWLEQAEVAEMEELGTEVE